MFNQGEKMKNQEEDFSWDGIGTAASGT